MKRTALELTMKLTSDAIFSSGKSIPGGEDIAVKTDKNGMPYLAGSTFKGLLLESMKNLLCWQNESDSESVNAENKEIIEALFGKEERSCCTVRRLVFSDFNIADISEKKEPPIYMRYFTAVENHVAQKGSLRIAACIYEGTEFHGYVICGRDDAEIVAQAIKGIKSLGLLRNRGFGNVEISVGAEPEIEDCEIPQDTHWLHYQLKLITPMSVSLLPKNSLSWSKRNFTETKTYLPGSAVRGMVISTLAAEYPEWFSQNKTALFADDVRFLNAYIQIDGEGSIPTPNGFYEDKKKTRFYSVLTDGVVQPGDKRAKTGRYCRIQNEMIFAKSPSTEGKLRIKRAVQSKDTKQKDKSDIFTVRVIESDTVLEGYIYLEDASLTSHIAEAFKKYIWLGADRYNGCGLCKVENLSAEDKPYWAGYSISDLHQTKENLTMLLLSPTCMIKDGEPVGIDCDAVAKLLDVQNVEITACASSVIDESGFNRTWGCMLPTDRMYQQGSVFKLHCTPAPTAERLASLEKRGIGIRRNEGFGQILFLSDYDNLKLPKKSDGRDSRISKTAEFRRARCSWLLKNNLPSGLSKSQMGTVQELLEDAIEKGGDSKALEEYFEHNISERGEKHASKFVGIINRLTEILDTPISETIGTEFFPDTTADRMRLICDWIDLSRKGENK